MFQYEYEKRPPSASSCESRATATTDWSRSYPNDSRSYPNDNKPYPNESRPYPNDRRSYAEDSRSYPNESRTYSKESRVEASIERARRPLPPRPIVCERMPTKTTVPLKVWVIASASCFAVCAALVLATVVITRWGAGDSYSTREVFSEQPEPIYANYYPKPQTEVTTEESSSEEIDNEIQMPILEKLSIFKNIVANRDRNRDLMNKPQLHPAHDSTHHNERKIEKKDKAKLPDSLKNVDLTKISINEANEKIIKEFNEVNKLPEFKPILPNVIPQVESGEAIAVLTDIKLPEGYVNDLKNNDYEEYYNDENFYDDYMQSNTMTSYLIEKVQELHDWITKDPDFDKVKNTTRVVGNKNEFGQLLKALNDSLQEGNVTIVMSKLRDMYFGDNYTNFNSSRKVILTNGTDLLSFGILTLDVMLLHNIQLMAWENQESSRTKMLKDPDVFAFNALFMDPNKVMANQNEVMQKSYKRQNLRQQDLEEFNLGANLFENVLEVGVSAARAAIHLGRAYKNTRNILSQVAARDSTSASANIQALSRNVDGNTHALNHLQTSFNGTNATSANGTFYTELDCVWLLYCRNLVATAKLNPPFGTMARINGMALRMLAGELSADRALDTMLYEVLTGWTELQCDDMFPNCSKVNAASVVMENIVQPVKKTQASNRGR